ncbi:hypothetical protein FQA39_LY13785 [Lamprigera yunnana]|nr:hypothetical protein FQA39_LY13785 [Lamprigera yunnana]
MQSSRSVPNILITGTPGVGKSTLSEKLSQASGLKWLEISKIAKENECVKQFDPVYQCSVLDEDKLLDGLEELMSAGGNIVDYLSCDFFPERWFDIVFVLRTDNTTLYDRLVSRGYEGKKLEDNIDCEIFETILEEAKASYAPEIVHELFNTNCEELERVMADIHELLIVSDTTEIKVWNCENSGYANCEHSYKGKVQVKNKTLNLIENDYLCIADSLRPLLKLWHVHEVEELKVPKYVISEPASVTTVTNDGQYLIAALGKKLHVWNIFSGALLFAQEVHLSPVTCFKLSSNYDFLIVGAANGNILVYNFGDLLNLNEGQELGLVKPMYSVSNHTHSVTDMYIGSFGTKSRFVTVSLDYTCNIHHMYTGQLLLQLLFSSPLTAVVVDDTFRNLYLGSQDGNVEQIKLHNAPRSVGNHNTDDDGRLFFLGNRDYVNCLTLNLTCEILVSGSNDGSVIVWNIESRQVLNKMNLKTSVTNIRFILDAAFNNTKPKISLRKIDSQLSSSISEIYGCAHHKKDLVLCDHKFSNFCLVPQ